MKKLLLSFLVFLGVVISGTMVVSANGNNIQLNGDVFLEISERDWKSFDQVKEEMVI